MAEVTVEPRTIETEPGITIQEAVDLLGVSERTIRRRIKNGELRGWKVPTAQGYEWRVNPDTAVGELAEDRERRLAGEHLRLVRTEPCRVDGAETTQLATREPSAELLGMVHQMHVDNMRLADQNVALANQKAEIADQAGYYRAKYEEVERLLEEARQNLRVLSAPQQPTPSVPWWRTLLGLGTK